MSSHREAPAISKDPVADNTDTYAFLSGNGMITIISNYLPAQTPAGGPNFYEFGDDVLYEIHVDNDGDGFPDVTYQFRFTTEIRNPNTFLYNTGPIASLDSANWNRRQTYTVTKVVPDTKGTVTKVIGSKLVVPPCNIGPRSTPNYAALATAATYTLPSGEHVFAGQRADAFFVDLGSVFDLGTLRPIESLHLIPTANQPGVDTLARANVHSIAIQIPITDVLSNANHGKAPTNPELPSSVIGVYATASRQKANFHDDDGDHHTVGPWVQVSRLGNPLFNEVIVPMAKKDLWNRLHPYNDNQFAKYVAQPELAKLLPVLYPGKFPNLAGLTADRADLLAILLTGIPSGIIPGFSTFTSALQADELRLNLAIPPAATPNRLGVLGNDLAGFPNGRRLTDDVVTIELRAVAGATYPLVHPGYVPDAAIAAVEDGTFGHPGRTLLSTFPFMGTPYSGYDVPAAVA